MIPEIHVLQDLPTQRTCSFSHGSLGHIYLVDRFNPYRSHSTNIWEVKIYCMNVRSQTHTRLNLIMA